MKGTVWQPGYPFQLQQAANPDSDEVTHIGVFLSVMKGRYDAVLKWPFKAHIEFVLLSLDGSNDHVKQAMIVSD